MAGNKRISELTEYLTPAEGDYLAVVDTATHETKKIDFINFKGDKGDTGATGTPGTAATVDVGTTTTLAAGSSATVTNSGDTTTAVFNFGIPKGDKGDKGDTGDINTADNITANGVFIDSDSENNSAQFSYGYGFNPLESEYYNKKFRIESFLESPFFSCGVARNYLLQTEVFGTTWVNTGGTLTSNDVLNPGGSATADSLTAGGDGTANIYQTITNNATGYWSAGLWLRSPDGTGTVDIQINSGGTGGGETGTPKTINLDAKWRFYAVTQEFTAAHTTKTFKITYGTTAISLWGARMNPGKSCNAYNARTTTGLTAATPGVFFNNTPVYATTFSGNATTATTATSAGYSNYGSYFGNTLSDAETTNNTNKWEYFGNVTITYQATYSYGSSYNVELLLQEMSKDGSKTAAQLETARLVLKGSLASYAGNSATFNTNVPSMAIELSGENLTLTKNDVACRVESTSTSSKVIRFYVKLKDDNTHYNITVLNSKGASYASAGTILTSYCNFTALASQAVITDLPAAAQGDITYATDSTTTLNSALTTTGAVTTPSVVIADGGTIGQAAGPLLTFDDTNNDLRISGCQIGIGDTVPSGAPSAPIHIYGNNAGVLNQVKLQNTSAGVNSGTSIELQTSGTTTGKIENVYTASNQSSMRFYSYNTVIGLGMTLGPTKNLTVVGDIAGANLSGTNTGDQTLPTRDSLGLDTDDSPQFAGINLGAASDTTIARVSAGVISVEGVTVPTISSTNTLTNKRITPRVVTATDDATAEIDCDATDQYQLTAIANNTTFTVTGTPTNGQKLLIRLKDAGTAKSLTWNAVFRAIGVTLPTTTVASKTHYIGCVYNSADSKWDVLATGVEA